MEEEYLSSSDDESNPVHANLGHKKVAHKKSNEKVHTHEGQDEEGGLHDNEYEDGDLYYDDEEEVVDIYRCVHRLPFKGQRVNILHYNMAIEVLKGPLISTQKEQHKQSFFSKLFSTGKSHPKKHHHHDQQDKLMRYICFSEGYMLVLKSTPEEIRKYGAHFAQEPGKGEMPVITFNAQIRSARAMNELESIQIDNYKWAFSDENKHNDDITLQVKMRWRQLMNSEQPIKEKLYQIDKTSLGSLIVGMQQEMYRARYSGLKCLVS